MKYLIGSICSSVILAGCLSSNDGSSKGVNSSESSSKVTDAHTNYLVAQGYDKADIEILDNGVVLEGDIFIPVEDLDGKMALKKTAQRLDANFVSNIAISTIRVQIDPSVSGYTTAIQGALNLWSRIDSRLNMILVTTNPDITIYSDEAPNCPTSVRNLPSAAAGRAGLPTSAGRPFPALGLNLNTTFPAGMTMAKWEMVVLHELGHTIGLHHTNSGGGTRLEGTPSSDPASIMNDGSGNTAVDGLTGTSYWDARTLRMVHPGTPGHIYGVYRNPNGRTEVHGINRATRFQDYMFQVQSVLGTTNGNWDFATEDYNNDGAQDLYAIYKTGANNKTEVHVLNGGDIFQSYLWQTTTVLGTTNGNWDFVLADFNNDGFQDIYAINKTGANNKTEVHVLNGANNFQSYLWQTATALGTTNGNWEFAIGDFNIDGFSDIYAINRAGANNKTEVHVLNGANNFQGYLWQTTTVLPATNGAWDFKITDFDRDGLSDIYAINRAGANNKSEVHILNGANNFQGYLLQTTMILGTTNANWLFK